MGPRRGVIQTPVVEAEGIAIDKVDTHVRDGERKAHRDLLGWVGDVKTRETEEETILSCR